VSRKAVVYARISISNEESVSVARQIESAEQYAAARKWSLVATFTDEGVSASDHRPERRPGWRALLDTTEQYDVVIIWKVDRLARKVIDFLHADQDLQNRGAGIVAVEQAIDMTTPQGRAFATMLGVFAELEAAEISSRVAAARRHLIKNGRVVGGTVPYGWRSIDNPDGAGMILAQDPDKIDWVSGMAQRCQRGDTIYSIAAWLDASGAPLPKASQSRRKKPSWHSGTVERLLRNPVLAGMTAFNPGNNGKARGEEVLRDERGLPVVDESVAIMDPASWRAMVAALDNRDSAQSKPRALRAKTSGLLSGLVYCGDPRHEEPPRMWRGTIQGRPGYCCPECSQSISNFEEILIEEFLRSKGDWMRWSKITEVYEGAAEELPEVEHRLAELDDLIREATSREERSRLRVQQDALLDLRDELRQQPGQTVDVWNEGDDTFAALWHRAEDVEERRAVLEDALERVVVKRGRPGRRTKDQVLERLQITWTRPEEIGPRSVHV